mgnify:CR=1 FL=1
MKSIKVLLAVISLLLLSSCVFAQMSIIRETRSISGNTVVTKSPSYDLFLGNVAVSIYVDSIGYDQLNIFIMAVYPIGTKLDNSMIKIKFEDGSSHYFTAHYIDALLGYVEYDVTFETYNKLYTTNIKNIYLNNSLIPNKIEQKDFFIYFLNNHSKKKV